MRKLETHAEIHRAEQLIGVILIIGVVIAACLVLTGGIYYLVQHGTGHAQYQVFHGVPAVLESLPGTFGAFLTGSSRVMIQTGLFALVLLQSVRLMFCAWLFGRQCDWLYVLMNVFLIGILLHSFV